MAGTSSCENGSAVGRTFLSLRHLHGLSIGVRLNLAPESGSSPSASKTDAINPQVQCAENREAVPKAESYTLHDCADHVSPGVGRGETDQRSARIRIAMRGP